jgi:mono/diheme cytochrome c family protein
MDYPLWDLPASGLLIALVAIVHVFISHFAVGGGLFLVVTERLARRESNDALLGYVRRHSRFFVLVTLVFGAITGVGIWFTIALVHPQATSTLIQAFVWGWAIEWTFFVVEIAAAIVYYYGWDRMDARTHQAIGWIYFGAAWLSLAVINGILTFMLTPGDWVVTRNFWDGILNPTYLPGVAARTIGAMALAGLYALATAAWFEAPPLRQRLARYAIGVWVLPAAVLLPPVIVWYLAAASGAGVPVAGILGAPSGRIGDVLAAVFGGAATSGYPPAQRALGITMVAWALIVAGSLTIARWHPSSYGRATAALLMVCGLAGIGGLEWLREDLRKPYVIGQVMYVNGVWVDDVAALRARGVMGVSRWARHPIASADPTDTRAAIGREVFRLQCSSCHTIDGHLGIRPLVAGANVNALYTSLGRLDTWRHRRMPPFAGSEGERVAVATYLATLGGMRRETITAAQHAADLGRRFFDENCAMCHGPSRDFEFQPRGRSSSELYELIGRLPQIDDLMTAFEGTESERRAVADYLAALNSAGGDSEGGVQ